MESTTDFDLEELESRLYSQVFHSTENWDSDTQTANLNNLETRHVSAYVVSNIPINGNRYWGAKTNLYLQDKGQNIDSNSSRITSKENTLHEHNPNESTNTNSISVQSTIHQQNANKFPTLDTIIPLESETSTKQTNHEFRTKPLRYKSIIIPTTLELPKSKAKKMPKGIIKLFQLKGKESFKKFRTFLYHVEKSQSNNNTNTNSSINVSEDKTTLEKLSPKIILTANGIDRIVKLSDIPIPVIDESILPKAEELVNNDNSIITLSDSDSESVIEVPLPPVPIYNVDSSSESEAEENEKISYKVPFSPKNNIIKDKKVKYVNPAAQQKLAKRVQNDKNNINNIESEEQFNDNSIKEHSLQDCEINLENINTNHPVDMNISFTELEKDRDDFLHTPDSNTNDFLEHDVSSLSKNNLSFNFGLHSSDLDLSKDKEELSKSGPSVNDHYLYETESSCSEIGSVISKTRPVFNEINFESPIKDIFCEPDLSKFSNFITPNRNTLPSSQQSKLRSNILFAPVQTKACRKNVHQHKEMRDENRRRSHSDSSEYHSDATTLRVKKKNKKAKKKAKKKEKLLENKNLDSAVSLSPSEDLQNIETNPEFELVPSSSAQLQIEETISKPNITPANQNKNSYIKSIYSPNQIENFKFGPSSNTAIDLENSVSNKDKVEKSTEELKQENSTSSISSNRKRSSIADYYVDTYFADDCIILDEIGKQYENLQNNMEASDKQENNTSIDNTQTTSANIVTINDESISINNETTANLLNDVESSKSGISDNGVYFSFVDTWRKSTDNNNCSSHIDEKKNVNKTENETTPNKKLKTDQFPTVYPYVVTIYSSGEDSLSSEISVGKNEEHVSRTVTIVDVDENSSPDLIVVNVKNDKINMSPTDKKSPTKNIVANPFSFVNTYLKNEEKKSFKDFWTNDFTTFYTESWGQENFDLEKVQSSMSDDTSDWKIIPSDIIQCSPKRRGPFCRRCREIGHSQYNCTRFSDPKRCRICGDAGHLNTRCPQSFCTTCRKPSIHYTTKCRYCAHFRNIRCSLCQNVGHEMKYCPDLWRRYHLTTESHTELNASSLVLKSPNERWCSNCAKRGHCEDKCTYLRHEHFPTTPGIISYVPTYDNVFKLPLVPPAPNIPIFKDTNVTIADLRTIKNDVIQSSNKKYMNILKQLRQQCNKYDNQLINQIERLRRNLNNHVFSKKQIQEIHRIRARVARSKIS